MDLQGVWNHNGLMVEDRAIIMNGTGGGARIGDYTGFPLNDAGRQQTDSWMASRMELPEHQCHPHPAQYTMWGPGNFRITNILDPLSNAIIGLVIDGLNGDMRRTIWLDGRPRPSEYARHTWAGFSTGVWDGNMLTVTTTHLKEGWVNRNGIHMSDHGTLREHFIRHDDYLTVIFIVNDPEHFEEPFIRTTQAKFDPSTLIGVDECQPFDTNIVNVDQPPGFVPHWLPGQNPQLTEFGVTGRGQDLVSRVHRRAEEDDRRAEEEPGFVEVRPVRDEEQGVSRRVIRGVASSVIVVLVAATYLGAVDFAAQGETRAPAGSSTVQVLPVQGNVYMIVGAGANIAASVGNQGVLLVDTGNAASSGAVLAAVRTLSPKLPIQYILNTTHKADHTGGNDAIAKVGRRLVDADSTQAVILSHESILNRMSAPDGRVPPRPVPAWPTDTFFTQRKEVYFNGEPAILYHQPGATDGDTYVFFRRSDVLVAGDVYINTTFPEIDVAAGGHINGILKGLNDLLEQMISVNNVEDGTLVIPGHGRVADELDVAEYRDMVTIMRDRVQDAVNRGQTLAQVKGDTRIALEYEERYGGKGGPWTTEMFLEAVYNNLSTKPSPSASKEAR